jgi:hypothetical protein
MKRILVSLVSDQTIPNVLAIHHFSPDALLFVSTQEMEEKGKTTAILATLAALGSDHEGTAHVCKVAEDSLLDCHRKLDEWVQGKEEAEFVVNLTGGTKIMSIAAYEFFKDYAARMIYIPIPKNHYVMPFPKKSLANPVPLDLRLTVSQYLTAYGLKIRNEKSLETGLREAAARADLSRWIVENYASVRKLLSWFSSDDKGGLRKYRDEKRCHLEGAFDDPTGAEKRLLEQLGFARDNGRISKTLSKSEIRYLTGGWLEEFCLEEVRSFVGQGIDDAVIGPDIANSVGRNNEFDIMFTKDNALFTVECKSLGQHEDKKTDILYKIGALQKDFGLRAGSYLVSTSDHIMKDGKIKMSLRARAEQFKTVIVPPIEVAQFRKVLSSSLGMIESDQTHG